MYEKSQGWQTEVITDVSSIIGRIDEDKNREINEPPFQRFQESPEWKKFII